MKLFYTVSKYGFVGNWIMKQDDLRLFLGVVVVIIYPHLEVSHPVSRNKTRLAICVPRKSTHTTTEAIVSKTMLYSGSILIINTYIRV